MAILVSGFIALGTAGCVDAAAEVGASDRPAVAGDGDVLSCTAARTPISVVQNAAALGGADISMAAAQGMLLSSERQLRDAAGTANANLAALIDDTAEATAKLARSDDGVWASQAQVISALQADIMTACERVGVSIHFDAWVDG